MAATFKANESAARILIVDDHALIRYGLSNLLTGENNLQVCGMAEDVDDALEQIEATNPDLMVIDITLKTGNGIDLIKRIRARHPKVKLLVLSMHDESLFAERALHAGAMGYVNKQQATDTLVQAIRRVLAGRIHLSPEMTDNLLRRISGCHKAAQHEVSDIVSVERLSDRELEIFELTGQGLTTRQIAQRLHVSLKTVESHREHIRGKLNLHTGAELARHAVQWVLENH